MVTEVPESSRVRTGDRILVDKTSAPARWDVFSFRFPKDPSVIYAQRLVGLPGEKLEFAGGEVFIDGKILRKPSGTAEELWIPVHESSAPVRGAGAEERGWRPERSPSAWSGGASGWIFDGVAAAAEKLVFFGPITNRVEYNALVENSFRRHESSLSVGDVQIDCTLASWAGEGPLTFEWERESEAIRARIDGIGTVEIESAEAKSTGKLGFPLSAGLRLVFSLRDGRAAVAADGKDVCSLVVGPESLSVFREKLHENKSVRLAIGAARCKFTLTRLTVRRDIWYEEAQSGGAKWAGGMLLGPDEYFILGDNPPVSSDSRYFGPVPRANAHGVVRWIWWPPERAAELSRG